MSMSSWKKLSNTLSREEVAGIYSSGGKIAVVFSEDMPTFLTFSGSLHFPEGVSSLDELENPVLKNGYSFNGYALFADAGIPIVIDRITGDSNLCIYPIEGYDVYDEITLYDATTGTVGSTVYLVED